MHTNFRLVCREYLERTFAVPHYEEAVTPILGPRHGRHKLGAFRARNIVLKPLNQWCLSCTDKFDAFFFIIV